MYRAKNRYIPNSFYHVYNRGNRKNKIFFETQDYRHFINLQQKYVKQYSLIVYSYCLMPNHFHIILHSGSKPSEITFFMHRFMTAYSMYINRKYSLVGRVFQGPYHARLIPNKAVLIKVMQYIKDNPTNAFLVKNSEDYRWLDEASIVNYL